MRQQKIFCTFVKRNNVQEEKQIISALCLLRMYKSYYMFNRLTVCVSILNSTVK